MHVSDSPCCRDLADLRLWLLQQPAAQQVSLGARRRPPRPAVADAPCPGSPVKAGLFEAHLSRLQADSGYLLSEEFQVGAPRPAPPRPAPPRTPTLQTRIAPFLPRT